MVANLSCHNSSQGPTSSTEYASIEAYCMCFEYDHTQAPKIGATGLARYCETDIAIQPTSLATPGHLFDSTGDPKIVNSLKRILFLEKDAKIQELEFPPNSRFLILLKKKDSQADTLVYYFRNKFVQNSKYLLSYSFDVLDSIRRVLGKEKIDCLDD